MKTIPLIADTSMLSEKHNPVYSDYEVAPGTKPRSVLLFTDNEIASGIRYIMPALMQKKIPVNMLIYSFDHPSNFSHLVKLIEDLNVSIVGISLFSAKRKEYEHFFGVLKKVFPELVLVCGGPDVNSDHRPAMEWADFVCRSDGEIAFPLLCKTLLEHGDVETADLPNIFFKRNGKVFENRLIAETNLDHYDFPYFSEKHIYYIFDNKLEMYSDFDAPNYNVYASRGCPYKCTFCANHLFAENSPLKKYYRLRSVGNIIQELQAVKRRSPRLKFIAFHDEEFGVDRKWFEEFVVQYKQQIGTPFFVQMNPKSFSRDVVGKLKNAGLIEASFGLQSASERIREIYDRPEKLEEIVRANGHLHEFRVAHFFDIIVDNPLETKDDLLATLNFLLKLKKPFVAKTFDMTHLPETKLTNKLLKEGYIEQKEIEGNFVYETLSWRVREKDVAMSIEEKYIASLITLTGNLLIPNGLLRLLVRLLPYTPSVFKRRFSKIVLSAKFTWLHMKQHALINVILSEGYAPALNKVLAKFVGYQWAIQRTSMRSRMRLTLSRKLTGL